MPSFDAQTATDVRTLMRKLLGPDYPTDAETKAAWDRLYRVLPPRDLCERVLAIASGERSIWPWDEWPASSPRPAEPTMDLLEPEQRGIFERKSRPS